MSAPTPYNIDDETRKLDGRTREARQARAEAEQRQRAERDTPSERPVVTRTSDGRIEVVGRNGEVLSRTRATGGDKFAIPPEIIPEGYEYQWNTVTVINNGDITRSLDLAMYANGWRPVPADRHPGRFMERGAVGAIIVDGMRLDERPQVLCEQARMEELRTAKQLVADRDQALKLSGVNKNLPDGFNPLRGDQRRFLRTGGDNVRMSIDSGLDIPVPQHEIAGPGE